jgi:hypothetical protein
MIDSGARLFLDGEYYYRQLGELAINLSVAKTMTDAGWKECLEGSLAISKTLGMGPKVSLAGFPHAPPNAVQRREATDFIAREAVEPIQRVALVSDNELLRGALIALSWAMPKAQLRAFKESDHAGALRWLREAAEFDETHASSIWNEARTHLGARPRLRNRRSEAP